jgi:transposase
MGKANKSNLAGTQARRRRRLAQDFTLDLQVVHERAAAVDVGSRSHFVAVPPHLDTEPVREFQCFTADLNALADWIVKLGLTTVAMQSTGVYWIPLYEILCARGLEVFLVNARDTKNLPGRKSDVQECQWLLKLHTFGLLKNSFRPAEEIVVMRTIWRQRQSHVADAAMHVQRAQKALTQMNVQLHHVISDITGTTGTAIVKDILSGCRHPQQLARHRDPRIKADEATIAKSLEGNWRPEHLFVLKQEWASYESRQELIAECDRQLREWFGDQPEQADPADLPARSRNRRPRGNAPTQLNLREQLYRISGVDLTSIDGINVMTAQTVIAEVGLDLSRFPTEKNFVSWLNLAPNNKITGGKVIGRDNRRVVNRAGQALREAAKALLHSNSYLGAQYRRFRYRMESAKAVKAMAAKLARLVYRMLRHGEAYVDKGAAFYEKSYRDQQIAMLQRRAQQLGLQVIDSATQA